MEIRRNEFSLPFLISSSISDSENSEKGREKTSGDWKEVERNLKGSNAVFSSLSAPFSFLEEGITREKRENMSSFSFSNKKREEEIKKNRMSGSIHFLLLLFFQ
jgi:hypothetical protein